MSNETATGAAGDASAWLSTSEAAAALGVSARAVQKRAERGTLAARRVAHGRSMRWEIDGRELDANAGANRSQDVRTMDAKSANSERASVRQMDANGSPDGRQTDALTARLLAQLETENAFLRATVEQLQRDGAETRAALRAALKLVGDTSAPQLTAGEQLQQVATGGDAPASAPEAQRSAQTGAAGSDNPTTAKSARIDTEARESGAVDYDAIADLIGGLERATRP